MFKQRYLEKLQVITQTYPKPLRKYKMAAAILTAHCKEVKIRKESRFYKTMCEVLP